MDGLTWLILSWLVIGVFCYFMLAKVGIPQTIDQKITDTMIKSHTASRYKRLIKRFFFQFITANENTFLTFKTIFDLNIVMIYHDYHDGVTLS